jgi:hypothetical protein
MNDVVALQPIPLRELAPWGVLAFGLLLMLYLVGFDQGALSQSGNFLHELMHDGRHLFAVPCH